MGRTLVRVGAELCRMRIDKGALEVVPLEVGHTVPEVDDMVPLVAPAVGSLSAGRSAFAARQLFAAALRIRL